MRWFIRLLRRTRLERDLDAELRFHVDEESARLTADGMPREEARRRALAAFGGLEATREYTRDARGLGWLEDLLADLRHTARMMRRSPGFTAAATLLLAVSVGATSAIFNVMDALVLRPLPVARPSELSFLNHGGYDEQNLRFSHPAYLTLQQAIPEAQLAAMSSSARMQIATDGAAELVLGQLVSGNWFDLAGIEAEHGRLLNPADTETVGGKPVAVLSASFWTRRFGGDPSIVGRTVAVNGLPLTIVGIAARGFSGLTVGERIDVWAPVTLQHELRYMGNASSEDADGSTPWIPQPGISWLRLVLRTPAPVESAAIAARLSGSHRKIVEAWAAHIVDPERRAYVLRDRLEFVPGARGLSSLRESFTQPLRVLLATAAIVLIIACANVAGLLLARGAARHREFALRLSLGARRGRLIRQLMTESLALAAIGGIGALALAQWGGQALLGIASSTSRAIPIDLPLDWRFIGFTLAVSVATGVVFGLMPAVRLSRADLADALKSGGRIVGVARGSSGVPFGRTLIVSQIALSLMLVVGAILFLRTFRNLLLVDAGFAREQIVAARFDLPLAGINPDRLPALYDRLLVEAKRVPGVRTASLAANGPLTGSARISGFVIQGQPRRSGPDGAVREDFVGPEYFDMMGMSIVRGRSFDAQDIASSPDVVVVNEAMARKHFGDQNPVGRRIGYDEPADMEIVGVVRDGRVDGLRRDIPPLVYHAIAQHPDEYVRNLYVRVSGAPDAAKSALVRAVAAAEPSIAVRETTTLAELAVRTVSNERLISELTATFGAVALFVACLGLYGIVSYSVVRRTNEFGVRLALGASPSRLRWLVVKEMLVLVGAGSALGLLLVLPAMRLATSLLFGLAPNDPATLSAAAGVLLIMGILAAALPAWRASRIEPTTALRAD